MLSTAAGKASSLTDSKQRAHKTESLAGRRVWLPKLIYDALPYFYLASGFAAFFATLYISEWFWVLPHYGLFIAVCLHLGVAVYRRRHRKTPQQSERAD